MLDSTSTLTFASDISSADPDALTLLALALQDFGALVQVQSWRLGGNRQTAGHFGGMNDLVDRFDRSSRTTEQVSRDFAHADNRVSNVLVLINPTSRRAPNRGKGITSANRRAKRVVTGPRVRAAVISRKRTVTRTARVKRGSFSKLPMDRLDTPRTVDISHILSVHEVGRILALAASQIGVKEKKTNRTKYGSWYGMNGQSWCAMFVSWVAHHAGIPLPRINSKLGFAAVVSARSFARKQRLLTTKPRVGAVFLIIHRGGKGHTGFVESINWARRTITTIEGNTNSGGSRNGDGVYRRTRKMATINGGYMLIPARVVLEKRRSNRKR